MIKLNKKTAIGSKVVVGEAKAERKEFRDGHKFFLVAESRAMQELLEQEQQARERFVRDKLFLRRNRNPLNGEYTPRTPHGDICSLYTVDCDPAIAAEIEKRAVRVDDDEKKMFFSPHVPDARDGTVIRDPCARQVERNSTLRSVRDNYARQMEMLRSTLNERTTDVEQSILRSKLHHSMSGSANGNANGNSVSSSSSSSTSSGGGRGASLRTAGAMSVVRQGHAPSRIA